MKCTFRLHRWVWRVARRWFPRMFRFRRAPIVNRPVEERFRLRHRPHFLELERRKAPTTLSVAGLAAVPIALVGSQTPAQPEARPSTLDRLDQSAGSTDGELRCRSSILLRPILLMKAPRPPESTFGPEGSPPAANPLEDLRPQWVDQVLAAGYLQGLAPPKAFSRTQRTPAPRRHRPTSRPVHRKGKPIDDGTGGGGGGGGGRHGETNAAQGVESQADRVTAGTALSGEQIAPDSQALRMLEMDSGSLGGDLSTSLAENGLVSSQAVTDQALTTLFNEGLPSVPNPTPTTPAQPVTPPASSTPPSSSTGSPAPPSSTTSTQPGTGTTDPGSGTGSSSAPTGSSGSSTNPSCAHH